MRHVATKERLPVKIKNLPELQKGDKVSQLKLVGNHPRRWERTGTVLEWKLGKMTPLMIKQD